MGIEPTSSAWKAVALTIVLYSQFWVEAKRLELSKYPQCKCGAVTNFATPPIKNSHILFMDCVSLIFLYFVLFTFYNVPDNYTQHSFPVLLDIHTFDSH